MSFLFSLTLTNDSLNKMLYPDNFIVLMDEGVNERLFFSYGYIVFSHETIDWMNGDTKNFFLIVLLLYGCNDTLSRIIQITS